MNSKEKEEKTEDILIRKIIDQLAALCKEIGEIVEALKIFKKE